MYSTFTLNLRSQKRRYVHKQLKWDFIYNFSNKVSCDRMLLVHKRKKYRQSIETISKIKYAVLHANLYRRIAFRYLLLDTKWPGWFYTLYIPACRVVKYRKRLNIFTSVWLSTFTYPFVILYMLSAASSYMSVQLHNKERLPCCEQCDGYTISTVTNSNT